MDITFELVGDIAIWMFIAELILLVTFKKSGKQFKFLWREFTPGLNPFIKKRVYILIAIPIFFVVALTQNLTNFVDIFLINFIGNKFLLYLIAISFDIFYIAKELAGMSINNNWVKYPLYVSIGLFVIAMILKYI